MCNWKEICEPHLFVKDRHGQRRYNKLNRPNQLRVTTQWCVIICHHFDHNRQAGRPLSISLRPSKFGRFSNYLPLTAIPSNVLRFGPLTHRRFGRFHRFAHRYDARSHSLWMRIRWPSPESDFRQRYDPSLKSNHCCLNSISQFHWI